MAAIRLILMTGQPAVRAGGCQLHVGLAAVCGGNQQRRYQSQSSSAVVNLSQYKRGTGGKSSFSGLVTTVFGASGFMGRYVVNRLGKIGSQVICPNRGEPYYMRELKLAGDLGQILILPYIPDDDESVRRLMKYSNVVINLVGRDWETKNYSFERANVEIPRRIARLAHECGVQRLVHLSHLNAQPNPRKIFIKGGSGYLRSKYYGEMAVREEFPDVTVLRPADIFGEEDRFIHYYTRRWRRVRGKMPLWRGGKETIKSPVFCSDVAEGIINAVLDPETAGKTYECVGPKKYYLNELLDYMYQVMRYTKFKTVPISPIFLSKVMLMSYAPSYPLLTLDKLDREHISDETTGLPTLEDLGVTSLVHIEDRMKFETFPWAKLRHVAEKVGDYPDPPRPLAVDAPPPKPYYA